MVLPRDIERSCTLGIFVCVVYIWAMGVRCYSRYIRHVKTNAAIICTADALRGSAAALEDVVVALESLGRAPVTIGGKVMDPMPRDAVMIGGSDAPLPNGPSVGEVRGLNVVPPATMLCPLYVHKLEPSGTTVFPSPLICPSMVVLAVPWIYVTSTF